MAKVYNLSGKVTNQLPIITITDDVTLTVNNRVDNMLLVRKYVSDKQKEITATSEAKARGEEVNEIEETDLMFGTLQLMVGKKSAEALKELNLPLPEFKVVYETVMAAAQGVDPEGAEFQK